MFTPPIINLYLANFYYSKVIKQSILHGVRVIIIIFYYNNIRCHLCEIIEKNLM